MKFQKGFITVFHVWEARDPEETFRFSPEDFETPEDQFDSLVACLMAIKEKGQEYKVLMDGQEIDL